MSADLTKILLSALLFVLFFPAFAWGIKYTAQKLGIPNIGFGRAFCSVLLILVALIIISLLVVFILPANFNDMININIWIALSAVGIICLIALLLQYIIAFYIFHTTFFKTFVLLVMGATLVQIIFILFIPIFQFLPTTIG